MRLLIPILFLLCGQAWGATQYICSAASGSGDGSSLADCKSAGTNFASITVGASDVLRVCDKIRGTLTVTSTNNVTVDLDCNGEASGEITGADVVTAFDAVDGNGEYATTGTFTVPMFVLVDGVAWKEGVKGQLADNEWAFNSAAGGTQKVFLGSNPAGRTVEIATRGVAVEFITSTGGQVTGGRIYGIRHTGSATGNGGVVCRASTCTVDGTEFYAVRRPTDATGAATMVVQNTSTSYCADGPDANKNTDAPSLTVKDSVVTDCGWDGWFTNTATSHALTIDREGIACTNCAALTVLGNRVERVNQGIAFRIDATVPISVERNRITDTTDEGLNFGCTNSSGVMQLRAASNIIRRAGSGGGWATSSYAGTITNTSCGNGSDITVAHNDVVDSSNGFLFGAAASQTGTIRHYNNVTVNANPEGTAGTHYLVSWNSVSATHSMTILSDDNDYYQTTGVGFFRWITGASARSYANYSLFLTDSSQDANSIRLDPLWLGGLSPTTAEGFRPGTGSSLCGAGKIVDRGMDDYFGVNFASLPAIGAIECGLPRIEMTDQNRLRLQ